MKRVLCVLLLLICLGGWALAEAASDDAWVQVDEDTALRAKPSGDAEVLDTVTKGSELDYLGKSGDAAWYKVNYEDESGWIDADDATVKWSTFY